GFVLHKEKGWYACSVNLLECAGCPHIYHGKCTNNNENQYATGCGRLVPVGTCCPFMSCTCMDIGVSCRLIVNPCRATLSNHVDVPKIVKIRSKCGYHQRNGQLCDQTQRDSLKALESGCTVDPCCLIIVIGNGLQSTKAYIHHIREAEPNIDHNDTDSCAKS